MSRHFDDLDAVLEFDALDDFGHGVSLLSGGSGRLDTRLDTPPSIKRRHPNSGIAPAMISRAVCTVMAGIQRPVASTTRRSSTLRSAARRAQ